MIGAIPNPTKKITIDFPISEVKKGVTQIPKVLKKYKMSETNELFNSYTLDVSEFLSFGVYIDINLTSVSDNRTDIHIEVRRKLGSFDQWVEVQNANEHINVITKSLSKILSGENLQTIKSKNEEGVPMWAIILGIIIGLSVLGQIL